MNKINGCLLLFGLIDLLYFVNTTGEMNSVGRVHYPRKKQLAEMENPPRKASCAGIPHSPSPE